MSCVSALAPSIAQAAPDIAVMPSLSGATSVAVGDTGFGQLSLTNHSTSPEDAGFLEVTELTLVPSCGADLADRSCVVTPGPDPGVITIGDQATGSGACNGKTFAVTVSDVASGKMSFASTSSPVTLSASGAASNCVVRFTYTVNHMATKDSSSAVGMQTDLVGFTKATATTNGSQPPDTGYETVTIVRDTPDLVTRASQSVQVGGPLSVSGTIAGTHPDGNMTFNLYGPGDPSCVGEPLFTSTSTVNGNGTYQSPTFTSTQAGTHRWNAAYGGDDDNAPVSSSCGVSSAATVVNAPPPPPVTPPAPPPPPAGPSPTGGGTGGTGAGSGTGALGGGAGGTGGTGGPNTGSAAKGASPLPNGTQIVLDRFKMTRRNFARATKATKLAATSAAAKSTKSKSKKKASKKGTTIKYRLSAPAKVTMIVERRTKGRRSGSKCVKATKKLRNKKSCTRYVRRMTIKRTHRKKGNKKVYFSGRAGKKAIAVGTYRVRATAAAGAGTKSKQRIVKFKILRR